MKTVSSGRCTSAQPADDDDDDDQTTATHNVIPTKGSNLLCLNVLLFASDHMNHLISEGWGPDRQGYFGDIVFNKTNMKESPIAYLLVILFGCTLMG